MRPLCDTLPHMSRHLKNIVFVAALPTVSISASAQILNDETISVLDEWAQRSVPACEDLEPHEEWAVVMGYLSCRITQWAPPPCSGLNQCEPEFSIQAPLRFNTEIEELRVLPNAEFPLESWVGDSKIVPIDDLPTQMPDYNPTFPEYAYIVPIDDPPSEGPDYNPTFPDYAYIVPIDDPPSEGPDYNPTFPEIAIIVPMYIPPQPRNSGPTLGQIAALSDPSEGASPIVEDDEPTSGLPAPQQELPAGEMPIEVPPPPVDDQPTPPDVTQPREPPPRAPDETPTPDAQTPEPTPDVPHPNDEPDPSGVQAPDQTALPRVERPETVTNPPPQQNEIRQWVFSPSVVPVQPFRPRNSDDQMNAREWSNPSALWIDPRVLMADDGRMLNFSDIPLRHTTNFFSADPTLRALEYSDPTRSGDIRIPTINDLAGGDFFSPRSYFGSEQLELAGRSVFGELARRTHASTDFLSQAGEEVFAVISGRITAAGRFNSDPRKSLVFIEQSLPGGYSIRAKILYTVPRDGLRIGDYVEVGELIGLAQDTTVFYPNEPNHVHVQMLMPNGQAFSPWQDTIAIGLDDAAPAPLRLDDQ